MLEDSFDDFALASAVREPMEVHQARSAEHLFHLGASVALAQHAHELELAIGAGSEVGVACLGGARPSAGRCMRCRYVCPSPVPAAMTAALPSRPATPSCSTSSSSASSTSTLWPIASRSFSSARASCPKRVGWLLALTSQAMLVSSRARCPQRVRRRRSRRREREQAGGRRGERVEDLGEAGEVAVAYGVARDRPRPGNSGSNSPSIVFVPPTSPASSMDWIIVSAQWPSPVRSASLASSDPRAAQACPRRSPPLHAEVGSDPARSARTAKSVFAFADLAVIRQADAELGEGASFRAVAAEPAGVARGPAGLRLPASTAQPAKVLQLKRPEPPPLAALMDAIPARDDARIRRAVFRSQPRSLDDGDPGTSTRRWSSYRRALELDPYLVPALINLANIHYARDEIAEAQALYERAIALEPDVFEAHFNLGNIFHDLGSLHRGAGVLPRSAAPQPDLRGRALLSGGDAREERPVAGGAAALARLSAAGAERRVGGTWRRSSRIE